MFFYHKHIGRSTPQQESDVVQISHNDLYMLGPELHQYLHHDYPQENARCEWKEFKNLKNLNLRRNLSSKR